MGKKLVIIGGGAAGFFCGINAAAANPDLQVTILEKTGKLLSKVRVSGGGRCNVTHHCFEIDELVRRYPRGKNFLKKAFHWFGTADTVRWFESRGVPLKTEADGRMFPQSNTSESIVECLVREANLHHVDILLNCNITSLRPQNNGFLLVSTDGRSFQADYVCIACGGFPKSEQFNWLRAFGHTVEEPVPSLFTFNIPDDPVTALMGVTVENAIVKVGGTKLQEQGPVLITHWGLSGPAVLRVSAWGARVLASLNYHFEITVNWLAERDEHLVRQQWLSARNALAAQQVATKNPFGLPARLWEHLLSKADIGHPKRWAETSSAEQQRMLRLLTSCPFAVKGKTTFRDEFVTCGGISLQEISPGTMESRKVPGLYFAGEVMDVDGITGGFNFQHAWTSGWIAARAISAAAAASSE
ncbi:MAG TPA: NAD(P)/FAD-dependent oxidoreductase [Chitinophagaceae bacterium]